jgi:hypothetical protein
MAAALEHDTAAAFLDRAEAALSAAHSAADGSLWRHTGTEVQRFQGAQAAQILSFAQHAA